MKFIYPLTAIAVAAPLTAVSAAETITHTYDALGRIKQSTKSGGPHSGSQNTVTHDPAGNRLCKSTTGVPGGPATPTCPPPPPPPP